VLQNSNLFAGMDPDDIATLERHTVQKAYRKNTVIMERGDEANTLFVLTEGRVKAYVSDEEGKEIILSEMGPGAHFGELALLRDIPRTASVMTLEDSSFLVLTKRSFVECLTDHPKLALNLIGDLIERIQILTQSVSDLALLDVYGRIAKVLAESAEEIGGRKVTPRFTHQEIADRVGASREMVSKILKDLKAGGYLTSEGKQLILERKLPPKW
jgi:CRP/FNR family cyclic AMP-dependent transcriptional regulator